MAGRWGAVTVLGAAQFVMVLDSTVMNVSISTVVADLDTTIAAMQSAITFYTLTMAAFMLLGAKLGDVWGRKRALIIGSIVYAIGSLTTALSPNIVVLFLGWSIVEGLGAVLVIPAIAALIADNYQGHARVTAFAVIGASSGAAVAAGPLIGGFLTTYASWRYVFAGEVVIMAVVLLFSFLVGDHGTRSRIRIDILSVLLSAAGLVLIVYALLQTKSWGWILAGAGAPYTLLGLSPVPYLVAAGCVLLWLFFVRQRRLVASGRPPLLDVSLLRISQLRAGVGSLAIQYTVTAGLFFIVPIYLQLTLGLDALETGIRVFPLSISLVLFSVLGTMFSKRFSPRLIARIGQLTLVVASLILLGSVDVELNNWLFATGMFIAGAALGLLASQLGNVTMSAVGPTQLSEAGGIQGVFQNLGSSLGTALIGSVMIASLSSVFAGAVAESTLPDDVKSTVQERTQEGITPVAVADVPKIATDAGLGDDDAKALAGLYETSQLRSLELSFAALALVSCGALFFSRNLPREVVGGSPEPTPSRPERRSARRT
ncbi:MULTISPECIES: MFS transporter [unclassified Leifsonia]|uniref:MFS transporter n=1 Tax=unclassified Leifsonia TaxID=2663824 RepID=UPI000371629F|nr:MULTISPECIES: MFS transporter [unclassified Leifsonia]TDP98927.1 MFS transporter [Leifsonia sp. 115AMFTsu3.1]